MCFVEDKAGRIRGQDHGDGLDADWSVEEANGAPGGWAFPFSSDYFQQDLGQKWSRERTERGQVQGTYIYMLRRKTQLSQYASACSETDAPKLSPGIQQAIPLLTCVGKVRLFFSTIYINSLKLESSFGRQIFVFSELKSSNETNLEYYLGAFYFYSYLFIYLF